MQSTTPTLCSTFTWDGGLFEGFTLPRTSPGLVDPALYVGTTYIRVDRRDGTTCAEPVDEQRVMVRRASLKALPHGKHTIYFFVDAVENAPYLVHIRLGIPTGRRLRGEEFWSGVRTTARVIAADVDECLLEIQKGEEATVFLKSGGVKKIMATRTGLKIEELAIERQANQRLERAKADLETAQESEDTELRENTHAEIVTVMIAARKFSEPIFQSIFNMLMEKLMAEELGNRTIDRILRFLTTHAPAHAVSFGKHVPSRLLVPEAREFIDLPATVKSFNRLLKSRGPEAACSFAAWSGENVLHWAAQKLRAGEWDPDRAERNSPKRSPRLRPVEKDTPCGNPQAKILAKKRRDERIEKDKARLAKVKSRPRPGQHVGHKRSKK